MPFDGAGVFHRVRNWVNDATAGLKIRADLHDSEDDNLAAGLTNCITRDGQSTVLQNIPMNNHRITGLADPVNDHDAVNKLSVGTLVTDKMPLDGGTMTGPLILFRDPVDPMEASTKQYTDAGDAATLTAAAAAGDLAYQAKDPQLFAGIPINTSSSYTTVATDAQKCIAGTGIITIASGLYNPGTVISFVGFGGVMTIACTDILHWVAPTGATTGNRTLAQWGVATALKLTDGSWVIGGNGLT